MAYTGKWNKRLCRDYNAAPDNELSLMQDQALHELIGVQQDEYLFEKDDEDAMPDENSILSRHLKGRGIDTLIMDGVKYDACLEKSIISALNQGFRVYVPLDATNCPSIDFNIFARMISMEVGAEKMKNVTFTTTDKIQSALQSASNASMQLPQMRVGVR